MVFLENRRALVETAPEGYVDMAQAVPKLSLRERNKIRMRAELLDAVLDLFLEDPAALTIEAIARHAGCSKATVYVYYPGGLAEMLCTLYADISDQVYDAAQDLRARENTPHGRIMAMADALLDMAVRPRRGVFYAQLNPTFSPDLQSVLGRTSERFEAAITEDLKPQFGASASSLAILIVGALDQASIKIAQGSVRRETLRAAMSDLVHRLLSGEGAAHD